MAAWLLPGATAVRLVWISFCDHPKVLHTPSTWISSAALAAWLRTATSMASLVSAAPGVALTIETMFAGSSVARSVTRFPRAVPSLTWVVSVSPCHRSWAN